MYVRNVMSQPLAIKDRPSLFPNESVAPNITNKCIIASQTVCVIPLAVAARYKLSVVLNLLQWRSYYCLISLDYHVNDHFDLLSQLCNLTPRFPLETSLHTCKQIKLLNVSFQQSFNKCKHKTEIKSSFVPSRLFQTGPLWRLKGRNITMCLFHFIRLFWFYEDVHMMKLCSYSILTILQATFWILDNSTKVGWSWQTPALFTV